MFDRDFMKMFGGFKGNLELKRVFWFRNEIYVKYSWFYEIIYVNIIKILFLNNYVIWKC